MPFNQQEQQIIQFGRTNNKSSQEIIDAISKFRQSGQVVTQPTQPTKKPGFLERAGQRIGETLGDIRQTGQAVVGRFTGAADEIAQIEKQPAIVSSIEAFGIGVGAVTESFGDIIQGIIKVGLSQNQEQAVKEVVNNIGQNPLVQNAVQEVQQASDFIKQTNPDLHKGLKAGFKTVLLGLDVAGFGIGKKVVQKGVEAGIDIGVKGIKAGQEILSETGERFIKGGTGFLKDVTKKTVGIRQQVTEFGERIPRVAERVKQASQEATERAARIADSSPAVVNAIKVNLDNRIINTIVETDDITRKGFKEIVNIAESTSKKLGIKERPEIVAGRAAEEQFKLIEKQRQVIGKQIGEAIDKLSKTTKVNITDSINSLKNILIENGGTLGKIKVGHTTIEGWIFKGKITKAETAKINELWSEIQKGVKGLTPREIKDFDQLFSKLQRETRLEGIGGIRVDTPDGNQSLFRVFRDVFSKKLDTLSPTIRGLNKEFREIVTFIDDIENSIVKGGNFQTVKDVGSAEFAQTNLRRLLSDAQSAAAFREIASKMDDLARELGYTGAKPEDLIAFATEIRKIFPDVIPPTSFTGGIRTGLKPRIEDIAEKVLQAGTPNLIDQQKALIELLNSL